MKAWSMFVHSLRLVINNLDVALRVSLVLYSVQAISQIYTFSANSGEMVQGPDGIPYPDISAGEGFVMLLLGIAALLASLWIAVAWHRYVLLGEEPAGWLPNWPGAAIPGYLWRSVLLGLVVALAAVPVGAISAVILPPVLYLLFNLIEAQFVTPALVGKNIAINPLLIFVSLVVWLWLWGPIGAIVAIPMLAILLVMLDVFEGEVPGEVAAAPSPKNTSATPEV